MMLDKKIAVGMGTLLLLSSMIMLSGNASGFNADLPKRVTAGKEYNDTHIEVSGVYLSNFSGNCAVTLKLLTESCYEITTLNKTSKFIGRSPVDFYLDFTIPNDLEEGKLEKAINECDKIIEKEGELSRVAEETKKDAIRKIED